MEASFTAEGLKTFQHALTCLSKLSESLNLHVSKGLISPVTQASTTSHSESDLTVETSLRISAINTSESAFCAFVFAESWFDHIRLRTFSRVVTQSRKFECQVNIRSLLASLKTNSSRKLERCEFDITDHGQECRFAIRLHHQFGVTKTHRLTYEAQAAKYPSTSPDGASHIMVSPTEVQEWLQHFAITGRGADISFWCEPDSCAVRSKSDEFEMGKARRMIQTEVKLETSTLDVYHIVEQAYLSLPLKEFRAAVAFAEAISSPLDLHFSAGGEPLFVKVLAEDFNAEVVIATTDAKPPEAPVPRSTAPYVQPIEGEQLAAKGPATSLDEAAKGAASHTRPSDHTSRRAPTAVPQSTGASAPAKQSPARLATLEPIHESQDSSFLLYPSLRPSQFPCESTAPPRAPIDNPAKSDLLPQSQDDHGTNLSTNLFRGGPSASQDQPALSRASAPPLRDSARVIPPPASTRRRLTSEPEGVADNEDSGEDEYGADETFGQGMDYAEALDEMEGEIRAGRIQVHGSQQIGERSEHDHLPARRSKQIALEPRYHPPSPDLQEARPAKIEDAHQEDSNTLDGSIGQYLGETMEEPQALESIQLETALEEEEEDEEELPATQAHHVSAAAVGGGAASQASVTEAEAITAAVNEESLPRRKKFRTMNF